MFYLERLDGSWKRYTGKMFDDKDSVKRNFKYLLDSGHIKEPMRRSYRIVDEQGVIYYTFDGWTKTGKCRWQWTFRVPQHSWR